MLIMLQLLILLALTTGWPVRCQEEQVRVQERSNVTLFCRYNIPKYRLHKKSWCLQQGAGGFMPLVGTDGYLADSYKGRVSIVDLKKSGMVLVRMAELRESDSGNYGCAARMLYGLEVLQSIELQVYTDADAHSVSTETPAPERFLPAAQEIHGSKSHGEGDRPLLWGILRWVLFGVMASCPVLVCIIARSGREKNSQQLVKEGVLHVMFSRHPEVAAFVCTEEVQP